MKLPTTYNTRSEDTFATISRRVYGDENGASTISKANPGKTEPFIAGVILAIPVRPSAPVDTVHDTGTTGPDEVAITIAGERFRFWTEVSVTLAVDAFSQISLVAPFEVDVAQFREAFRPFSFQPITITVGGELLFTGTLIAVTPSQATDSRTITAEAYALPGVLEDCTMPASALPLQFARFDLKQIAVAVCEPFGLGVVFRAEPGAPFVDPLVALGAGQRAYEFLKPLAQQRGLVMSSDERGRLVFQQSADPSPPVAVLEQGVSPLLSVLPSFKPQTFYSHITGIQPTFVGLVGEQVTVPNTHLTTVTRPFTFTVADGRGGTIKTAVEAKMGRMFGDMAGYVIEVATWRDSSGKLWQPNTTIRLKAPGAMVYQFYDFIVRRVSFSATDKQRTAIITLALPGAFNSKPPEVLPWDE